MPLRKVQVTQEGLKLNGSHKILVYSDDINCQGKQDSKTPRAAQLAFSFK